MKWVASKPIPGYEGLYCITADGRVWSEPRERRCVSRWGSEGTRHVPGQWRKLSANGDGYLQVKLTKDGKRKSPLVHRLVAEAFVPRNGGDQVNHMDRDKVNNHFSNLEWCDHSHNQRHWRRTPLPTRQST